MIIQIIRLALEFIDLVGRLPEAAHLFHGKCT